ncbi:MAG: cellulase family glycosylhydrolase [Kineosporiaceae bacterium]
MIRTRRGLAARTVGSVAAAALAFAGLAAGLSGSSAQAASVSPAAATGTGVGFLSTKGNQIVDSTGASVRLTGINWFGLETDNHVFHGMWSSEPWKAQIDHMAQLGFNTLRIPYSNDNLNNSLTPSVNDYTNPDLAGLGPIDILDKVIEYAYSKGMRTLLDRHRPTTAGQSYLWYIDKTPEEKWISDWVMLAKKYKGNPAVIGADLHNEPHAEGTNPAATGACWGCGDVKRDWRLAAERAGNAIQAVNSDWLIVVEGVSCPSGGLNNVYDNDTSNDERCGWWGGNLSQAGKFPVRLNVPNKLVYSPHEYATSVYEQEWFKDASYPKNMPEIWDYFFGYLYKQNIAPILIGEFGSTLRDPRDATWLTELMKYTGTGMTGMSFTYWSWNPNSGDTGGIVQDDWKTVNENKMSILRPYMNPPSGAGWTPTPTTTSPVPTTTTPDPTTTTPKPTTSTKSTKKTKTKKTKITKTTKVCTTNKKGVKVCKTKTVVTKQAQPLAAGACAASVSTSAWGSGSGTVVEVQAGSKAMSGWKVTLSYPSGQKVTQSYGAAVSGSGQSVTASGGVLAAGAVTSFGVLGTGTSAPTATCSAA